MKKLVNLSKRVKGQNGQGSFEENMQGEET